MTWMDDMRESEWATKPKPPGGFVAAARAKYGEPKATRPLRAVTGEPDGFSQPGRVPPNRPDGAPISGGFSAYGMTALDTNLTTLGTATEGSRNDALNVAAFNIGQLIGGGEIPEEPAREALAAAARSIGLGQTETYKTIQSGFDKGKQDPRSGTGGTHPNDGHPSVPTSPAEPALDGQDAASVPTVPATWAPVDLTSILDGSHVPPVPTIFPRGTGGVCLIYPGLVHSFHGESESGKSLVLQIEAVRLITAGRNVLWLDGDDNPTSVVGRLLDFGASAEAIREHFHYVRPEAHPGSSPAESAAYLGLQAQTYDLAVLDGMTEFLTMFGKASNENDDIATFMRQVVRPIAQRTGAAVVVVDHMPKATGEARGRFAIGGQHKMAALDGAAYVVEVKQPLGRGRRGEVVLRIAKDRPGVLRAVCGSYRESDRTQEAARIVVDSRDPAHPVVTVEDPDMFEQPAASKAVTAVDDQRLAVMEQVSRVLENAHDGLSMQKIRDAVKGKHDRKNDATEALQALGYVALSEKRANGGHRPYISVRPYREADGEPTRQDPGHEDLTLPDPEETP